MKKPRKKIRLVKKQQRRLLKALDGPFDARVSQELDFIDATLETREAKR